MSYTRRSLLVLTRDVAWTSLLAAGCGRFARHEKKHGGDDAPTDAAGADAAPTRPWGTLEPLPPSEARIWVEGDKRLIIANGLPDHETGIFPNRYNPNPVLEQDYHYAIPALPQKAAAPLPIEDYAARRAYNFGVAVNGVLIDPTGPWYKGDAASGWHFDALKVGAFLGIDVHHAHTQGPGKYHYHGSPRGLVDHLLSATPDAAMLLVGWAADGFPIYWSTAAARSSYRLREGVRESGPGGLFDGTFCQDYEYVQGLGDLDECNGREGPTPEFPEGTYYYVVTDAFPYLPRLFRGTPSEDFRVGGSFRAPMPAELFDYVPKTS